MTLLQSLFLGRPGNYRIGDIPISIYREGDGYDSIIRDLRKAMQGLNESKDIISDTMPSFSEQKSFLRSFSLNSTVALLSQQYFYAFIHEMGHAVAIKFLKKNEQPKVSVYLEEYDTNYFTFREKIGGEVTCVERLNSDWKDSIILASGPLSECIVSGVQCVAIAALGHYLPSMVAKSMYFLISSPFIGRSINSVWCFGKDSDFSNIKKISYKHLIIATALVAGNAFMVIAMSRKINPEIVF